MFDETLKAEIIEIAVAHNIEPAALLAVVEVESGGRLGAKIKGRIEPLIRFEGHYFYRLLPNGKRNIAIVRGLASAKAGIIKNPLRQAARWQLLKRAEMIDRSAALSSCSWGCGQVMGSHWRWLGMASIDALVVEARDGAAGQIRLMMRYIEKAGLVDKLQHHDWAGFARAYNGPAFRKYKYDSKMRAAYKHHMGHSLDAKPVRDLPLKNGMFLLRVGSSGEAVHVLQENLRQLGYFLLVDGDFGPATERMVRAFQLEHDLKADGIFGPRSLAVMQRHLPGTA